METYSIKKWQALFFITWIINIVFLILSNLVMWYIYHIEHPFFERYKINRDPWPWYADKKEWNKLLKKSLLLVGFNVLVVLPSITMLNIIAKNWDVDFSFELEKLPDSLTLVTSIVFMMICEDLMFHFNHRLLHWKVIYPFIHKIHH
jgi:sterol desaturase/sphingolipid hydroxylase (fatty acid hydroxylase superfamily)